MPREIPDCPTDKPTPTQGATRTYEIELITPMVGGGAAPGEVDAQFPIRPTAIRGQLRHWWRLIRGHSLGAKMWRREEEIFGSTEFPSPLTVCVNSVAKPIQFDPSDGNIVDRFDPVGYALFAAIENKQTVTKEGLKFTVRVQHASNGELTRRRTAQNERRRKTGRDALPSSIEPITEEIEQTVNAWLTFGGMGGRTRRGCGAIHARILRGSLPKIPARILLGSMQKTPLAAWSEALRVYPESWGCSK